MQDNITVQNIYNLDNQEPGPLVWQNLYSFSATLNPGDNIIAVKAVDTGHDYGLIGKFDCGAPGAGITTISGDNSHWKCTNTDPGNNWTAIDFNDNDWTVPNLIANMHRRTWYSAWIAAVPGAEVIWINPGDDEMWCRYKTTY